MPRPGGRTTPCTRATIEGRLLKSAEFWRAAELIDEYVEDQRIGAAYVTLCIHACIAAADVICCLRLGEHAHGENHAEAVALLRRVDASSADDLSLLLSAKTRVAYSATPTSPADVKRCGRAAGRLVDSARTAT